MTRRVGPRKYDLLIQADDGSQVRVRLQTEEAQGWMKQYSEALTRARSLTLLPTKEAIGYPTVQINLLDPKRKWVYFRRVNGRLSGPKAGLEFETHCLGWSEGDKQTLLEVGPDAVVRLRQSP